MINHNKRKIVAQMVGRDSPEAKEFDRNFWQNAGPDMRFEASWEMVQEVGLFRKQTDASQQRKRGISCGRCPCGNIIR